MATALSVVCTCVCPPFLSLWHFLIGHTGQEAKLFLVARRRRQLPARREDNASQPICRRKGAGDWNRCWPWDSPLLSLSVSRSRVAACRRHCIYFSHEPVCMPSQHLLPWILMAIRQKQETPTTANCLVCRTRNYASAFQVCNFDTVVVRSPLKKLIQPSWLIFKHSAAIT